MRLKKTRTHLHTTRKAQNHLETHLRSTSLTLGSTAQYCRIFSSLWVCSSCHRSGCRRLNDLSASYTPLAGSAHLTAGKTTPDKRTEGHYKGTQNTSLILKVSCFAPCAPFAHGFIVWVSCVYNKSSTCVGSVHTCDQFCSGDINIFTKTNKE